MNIEFRTKRIYDEPSESDGLRVLVDRLWPRGVSKEKAQIDLWPKELTPSNELRKWFHAEEPPYEVFVARYRGELEERREQIEEIVQSLDRDVITLLTATKDLERGHVAVLQNYLEEMVSQE